MLTALTPIVEATSSSLHLLTPLLSFALGRPFDLDTPSALFAARMQRHIHTFWTSTFASADHLVIPDELTDLLSVLRSTYNTLIPGLEESQDSLMKIASTAPPPAQLAMSLSHPPESDGKFFVTLDACSQRFADSAALYSLQKR